MNLDILQNKTIIMLGKSRAFSADEFASQLASHNITLTDKVEDGVDVVLEGRMLTPIEQNLFDALYEEGGYTFLHIDAFEKELASVIDEDVLLMSLKLSADKERLISFVKNSYISDSLFFKLLKMHDFKGEDFFENDANRDVSAALIERFYENIERNHNVQFATTGLIHLISQTNNSELLHVISELEPVKKHPKIQILLATHPKTPKEVLKRYMQEAESAVLEAMASNPSLDHAMAKELLKDTKLAKLIAQNIALDTDLFELLQEYKSDLAHNASLSDQMQDVLVTCNDDAVDMALAQNPAVSEENLIKLYEKNDSLHVMILSNPNVSVKLLQNAFANKEHLEAIAQNPNAPQEVLQELYVFGESEILENLAKNTATPVDILYQLGLDSRFERYVRTNESFGKHIQTQNIGWL